MLNEVYDLFIDLDATEEQLEFPVLYAIGRDAVYARTGRPRGPLPLFETILGGPGPSYDPEAFPDAGFGPRLLEYLAASPWSSAARCGAFQRGDGLRQ